MLAIVALVLAGIALVSAVATATSLSRRESELREARARLRRIEEGADLAVRDIDVRDDRVAVTLVNVGRGECLRADVTAATHGHSSAPVEVGSLPPARSGYPGTRVEIPLTGAIRGDRVMSVWLHVSYVDVIDVHRLALRLSGRQLAERELATESVTA